MDHLKDQPLCLVSCTFHRVIWARVDQLLVLGMGKIQPLMTGILISWGPINPYCWWVYPLLYGNNGRWSTRSHISNLLLPNQPLLPKSPEAQACHAATWANHALSRGKQLNDWVVSLGCTKNGYTLILLPQQFISWSGYTFLALESLFKSIIQKKNQLVPWNVSWFPNATCIYWLYIISPNISLVPKMEESETPICSLYWYGLWIWEVSRDHQVQDSSILGTWNSWWFSYSTLIVPASDIPPRNNYLRMRH